MITVLAAFHFGAGLYGASDEMHFPPRAPSSSVGPAPSGDAPARPDATDDEEFSDSPAPMVSDDYGHVSDLIALSLRTDTQFTVGSPYQQGFALPSLRFSIFGDLNDLTSYRVSLGQTREYSSVLLPQIMPEEALVNFRLGFSDDGPQFGTRIGMFAPEFHPLWTPDLGFLDYPDYLISHQDLFMFRELGVQAWYESNEGGILAGVGAFNGSGILGVNSNNSRAVTGFVKKQFTWEGGRLLLGVSGYVSGQSSQGSINYRSVWVALGYIGITMFGERVRLFLDGMTSSFEDSLSSTKPHGAAVSGIADLFSWFSIFGRWEYLSAQPPTGNQLLHFQGGPRFRLGEYVQLFTYYDYLSLASGSAENSFQMRLRLSL